MRIIYTTLNNTDEARLIGKDLLAKKLANCVNWFPITCMYNYEDQIEEEPEVVLIIKTTPTKFKEIEKVVKAHINYTNFIGELEVSQINDEFLAWLNSIVQ